MISLLIAAQDKAIRTIHIKAIIDKIQQNSNNQSHNKRMQQISTEGV